MRESLRLALQEMEGATQPEVRPIFWIGLWERYVESQADYRAGAQTLARKLAEAGADAWQLLEWLRGAGQAGLAAGTQAQLLARVFGEQFQLVAGQPAPRSKEQEAVTVEGTAISSPAQEAIQSPAEPAPLEPSKPSPRQEATEAGTVSVNPPDLPEPGAKVLAAEEAPQVEVAPREKGNLSSQRVQNPHDPQATYAVKGEGTKKKEHVGYKVQPPGRGGHRQSELSL